MTNWEKVFNIRRLLANPFAGYDLTDKQAEAMRLIAKGFSYDEIAIMLGISHQAITARVKKSCKKMKIKNSKGLTKDLIKTIEMILVSDDA